MRQASGIPVDISYENSYNNGPQKRILGYQRLEEELGWSPATTLEEGVSQTVSWFQRWLG
jgi:UDP-glucose 4-epimerase